MGSGMQRWILQAAVQFSKLSIFVLSFFTISIMKKYWVYMMQSANGRALYTGVTNNLERRVCEHKEGRGSTFTAKYKCHKLVYFEEFGLVDHAILREKEIKNMTRANKEELIDTVNPDRRDLFE